MLQNDSHLNCLCVPAHLIEARPYNMYIIWYKKYELQKCRVTLPCGGGYGGNLSRVVVSGTDKSGHTVDPMVGSLFAAVSSIKTSWCLWWGKNLILYFRFTYKISFYALCETLFAVVKNPSGVYAIFYNSLFILRCRIYVYFATAQT